MNDAFLICFCLILKDVLQKGPPPSHSIHFRSSLNNASLIRLLDNSEARTSFYLFAFYCS